MGFIEDETYAGCFYRMNNGVQEWLNPPMIAGVEYRTTMRNNGTKPVYLQLLELGITPAAYSTATYDISGIENIDRILSAKVYAPNGRIYPEAYTQSATSDSTFYNNLAFIGVATFYGLGHVFQSTIRISTGKYAGGNYPARAILEYTKTKN